METRCVLRGARVKVDAPRRGDQQQVGSIKAIDEAVRAANVVLGNVNPLAILIVEVADQDLRMAALTEN